MIPSPARRAGVDADQSTFMACAAWPPGYHPPMRILVLGGYGLFGSRICRALAGDAGLTIIIAGRSEARAQQLAAAITAPRAGIEPAAINTEAPDFGTRLAALRPDVVIDTAGPFQGRDYRVAEAVLAAGAHCIDLADGRDYVRGINALDATARAAGRWVISGASSVPGLHAAVIDALLPGFSRLDTVETAIFPGNRTPRGWATTLSILGYAGHPYRCLIDGAWREVHGWQSLRRLRIPGLGADGSGTGTRWVARCEIPDLDLLPARHTGLRTVEFRAGLELWRMHFGLWLATWAVRAGRALGLPLDLRHIARPLYRLSELWQHTGSDTGGMQVTLGGPGHDGAPHRTTWTLIARDGDGPQIPATAAVLLARKLARGELPGAGATACVGVFSLEEFLDALAGYSIKAHVRQ